MALHFISVSTVSSKMPEPSVLQISRPYFAPAELSYLHSKTIPDEKKLIYNQRKHQVFQFLFQIVRQIKFPLRVLSTAMNYFQRFYLFNLFQEMNDVDSEDLEKDPFTVALTALFLASKNEDCIKKLRDIQAVANKLREIDENRKLVLKDSATAYVDAQRKAIMSIEYKLLQTIKFDFINGSNIPSLDQLVVIFCKQLDIDYKFTFHCWLVSFDIMSTPSCLMISPHCMAMAIVIVTLNLRPKELITKFTTDVHDPEYLSKILEQIDCYGDFRCPETLVNEAIIYILDYYVHQMNFSILNEFMPPIDTETGKEQIFKFMNLKSKFNDLKVLSERSCSTTALLKQDEYLEVWDYNISLKGSSRFMLGNKRRRFETEIRAELASSNETSSTVL